MHIKIQKWGNSLAVRLPKAFANQAQIENATIVDINLSDGNIILTPVPSPRYTLEELLAKVTDKNKHGEVKWGKALGKEFF